MLGVGYADSNAVRSSPSSAKAMLSPWLLAGGFHLSPPFCGGLSRNQSPGADLHHSGAASKAPQFVKTCSAYHVQQAEGGNIKGPWLKRRCGKQATLGLYLGLNAGLPQELLSHWTLPWATPRAVHPVTW